MGRQSASDRAAREAQGLEDREAARVEARKARNESQAIEEGFIWGAVDARAIEAKAERKRAPRVSYSEGLALEIADRLTNGESLQRICRDPHIPAPSAIYVMIRENPFFKDIYARARENAAHTLFDQMIDIADNASNDLLPDGTPNTAAIARAKLQIDTRARVAGKLAPRVYGERVEGLAQTINVDARSLTISGRDLDAGQRDQLRALIMAARGNDGGEP